MLGNRRSSSVAGRGSSAAAAVTSLGRRSARLASGTFQKISRTSRQGVIARWQARTLPQQLFAVARHCERADGVYAFVNGERWTCTEDFARWPVDPPLSDAGLEAAVDMGQHLRRASAAQGSAVHVVVSSPYFRCLQTAVEVCKALGPGARLLVDRSLGEIYGPSVMGQTEPLCAVRPMEDLQAYCRSTGVACNPRVIGKWPTWP
jgi:hypothetical protein